MGGSPAGRTHRRWTAALVAASLLGSAPVALADWLAFGAHRMCRYDSGSAAARWCSALPQRLQQPPVLVRGATACRWVAADGSLRGADLATGSNLPPLTLAEPADALAASHDGQVLLVAHGGSLSALDTDGSLLRRWVVADRQGRPGRVQGLAVVASRSSFVVALHGLAEAWEIRYDPQAEPSFEGWVHDHRSGEGIAEPGYLGRRRTPLAAPLAELRADGRMPWVLARQGDRRVVWHLDVRRVIAELPLGASDAAPVASAVLGIGTATPVLAAADGDELVFIDTQRWRLLRRWVQPVAVTGLQAASDGATFWVSIVSSTAATELARWAPDAASPAARWPSPATPMLTWVLDELGQRLAVLLPAPLAGVHELDATSLRTISHWPQQDLSGVLALPR
jgi:hypothetical protein